MMVAEIQAGPPFSVGQRWVLFSVEQRYRMNVVVGFYDITADDQRFLMRRVTETDDEVGDTRRLSLVQNFFEELKVKGGELNRNSP